MLITITLFNNLEKYKCNNYRLTFAVASVVPQYGTFFDGSKRLKQQPHVIFVLLFVQHSDKQLPIFYNVTSHPSRCASTVLRISRHYFFVSYSSPFPFSSAKTSIPSSNIFSLRLPVASHLFTM